MKSDYFWDIRHNTWERWRPAGEFEFSAPDWPARRRRSQETPNLFGA
jgi:hypothetical protein